MPAAPITTLPTELLVELYKSLDHMNDVNHLSRALPRFHEVWCQHTVTISDAVLSREIESYDHACELAKIQQKFFERDHGDDNGHHDPYIQALERNKLINSNLNDFYELYEVEMTINYTRGYQHYEFLSSRIYYCICMLVFTEGDKSAQSLCLASLDLKTLKLMHEYVEWYFDERFVEHDSYGDWVGVPLVFGLEKIGGEYPEVTLASVQQKLKKACLDVGKARQVGNGAESA